MPKNNKNLFFSSGWKEPNIAKAPRQKNAVDIKCILIIDDGLKHIRDLVRNITPCNSKCKGGPK